MTRSVTYRVFFAFLLLSTRLSSMAETPNISSGRITLGGGCFWCIEAVYDGLPGVKSAVSGYAGGNTENPTYDKICHANTGHAEVVQIEFDPSKVSLEKLLGIFWKIHDPTTLNRQGPDTGTQYRSVVFHENAEQELVIKQSLQEAQKGLSKPIVTQVAPLQKFYPAEDYHQDYFAKNPNEAYCQIVIRPKLDKFEKQTQAETR